MASQGDRLADIGREGFALVDKFYGRKSGRALKQPYNVPKKHAPTSSDNFVMHSKKAAEKDEVVVVVEYPKKKFACWCF
ncbi:hypothetical protein BT93_H2606 [Corymbia citriodora subsp. variegata]|nr:hypothetical protein BT93_H2606 [Corymbia citriodora subsp. variegata]